MGMSTHAVGFKPADKKWNQMKAVWIACVQDDFEQKISWGIVGYD